MAADTFQDATARMRVNDRMACEDVTQIKNRKITVPCDSSSGILKMPCVTKRITSGKRSVVTNPVDQVRLENLAVFRLVTGLRERGFLSGLMNHVAAVQKDGSP